MNNTHNRWDIFCKIVDNFGDIGVCWRLSQQLAHEHGLQVRLFIDDVDTARKIITDLDIAQPSQTINGVEVCSWPTLELHTTLLADVVIETFACGLPDSYLQKMLPKSPHWINLEYLSAESWVSDFHAKPSQHPTLALTKHYFFPGFLNTTGGLIREINLIAARDAFLNSASLQKEFWREIGLETPIDLTEDSIKVSLFCYPQANMPNLFSALEKAEQPISLFVPLNKNSALLNAILADFKVVTSDKILRKGKLSVYLIPFLSQVNYDRLLWACDLNFVRGEDSWIRAIWAGKPFIWQPYIQAEESHIHKLKAFLDAYTKQASPEITSALYQAHLAWSQTEPMQSQPWQQLINTLANIQGYADQQTKALADQPDLAAKLVTFSENLTKK